MDSQYDRRIDIKEVKDKEVLEAYQEGDEVYYHDSCFAFSGIMGYKLIRNGKLIKFFFRGMS